MSDFTVIAKNGAIIAQNPDVIIYCTYSESKKRIKAMKKVTIKLDQEKFRFDSILCPLDKDRIIIPLKQQTNETYGYSGGTLFLTWDLKKNKELTNYSTSQMWTYMTGPGSRSGYIMHTGWVADSYVNLDSTLKNPFFESPF